MSDLRTDLPSVKAANFEQRIREVLMTYLGRQGNPLDRGVTLRDLLDSGIAKVRDGFTLRSGPGGSFVPLQPGEAFDFNGDLNDLTPPPTPTGFAVNSAISNIFIEHDTPFYTQGAGHLRTRVYGAIYTEGPQPTFQNAVEITQFTGTVHAHPTNPSTTWHLWIKWESRAGVLSASPAGGTNGLVTRTGEDVALLLEALTGQITESQLYADLGARIDLIDGSGAGSVNERITQEALNRAAAIADETQARTDAVAAETQARNEAILTETLGRNEAISIESHQRLLQVQSAGEAALNAIIAAENERNDRLVDTASARQELSSDLQVGLSAEAAARLSLTAIVSQNVADIQNEQSVRATADSALALDISTLYTQVGDATAAINTESLARADAVSAEATERGLLAAQLRGGYSGNDLDQVTTGLIFQERTVRALQDQSLAEQITLLSAGAGEQFDWRAIWYFDSGVEGWTGNGTPTTTTAGWLRPANQASDAYVESPTSVNANGSQYGQLRFRVRKVGTPTWAGFLWWRGTGDSTWDAARRVALDEPTYDSNGIGLVTISPVWPITIDRIRLDASSAQTATDYFEYDWVAIGRPSPGASSAQLLQEQQARALAISAEATSRETLATKLLGQANPDGLTLSGLTSGLIYDERTVRSTQDGALADSISSLQGTVTDNFTTLDAAITSEATARATADSAEVTARESLSTTLTGVADPSSLTLETLSSGLLYAEKTSRVDADTALTESLSVLSSNVGGLAGSISTLENTVANLDTASASTITTLLATDKQTSRDLDTNAEAVLRNALGWDTERVARLETTALARQDLEVKINTGLDAEATARLLLSARVDDNFSAFTQEQTARVAADESITTTLTAQIAQTGATAQAAITAETLARTTEDSALSTQINSVSAVANSKNRSYYQTTAPTTNLVVGDQWFDTANGNKPYRWSGALWQETTDVRLTNAETNITNETTARVNQYSALAETVGLVSATANAKNRTYRQGTAPVNSPAGTLVTGDVWFNTTDSNKAHRWTGSAWEETVDTRIAANNALIADINTARIGYCTLGGLTTIHGDKTTCEAAGGTWNVGLPWATAVKQVSVSDPNGGTAALEQAFSAQKTLNDDFKLQYTVKIDNNGYVSGFGLASTANNATPFSEFIIRADSFAIASPSGPGVAPAEPFIVRTTETTIGGVTVPVGVYMKDAFIQNGTITNAKIANLAVDDAKIGNLSASKLTAGVINTGDISSTSTTVVNSVAVPSWTINASTGNATFNNATVRGTVFATNGQFLGTLLGGSATNYTTGLGLFSGWTSGTSDANYRWRVGNPSGARIQWTGSAVEVYNASNQLTMTSGGIFGGDSKITDSNVSTYIANLAVGSAQIANLAVTNAKIGAAAITSAKIADLQVTTLKIGGEAVIVPRYGSGSASINLFQDAWSSYQAYVQIDISGLPDEAQIPIVVTGTTQIFPSNSTTTTLVCGIWGLTNYNFSTGLWGNEFLVRDTYTTIGGNGFTVATMGRFIVGNGTHACGFRYRCESNPSGATSKSGNNIISTLIAMGAKR
jgi:hypothetical protein